MKCAIFVSDKMGCVPVVECGGALLAPGDELLVKEEFAAKLKAHYGTRMIQVGDCTSDKPLRDGHYEVRRGQATSAFNADPKHQHDVDGAGVTPLEGVAADKSMLGKFRKSKGHK